MKDFAVGAQCGLEVRLHPGSSVLLRGRVVWLDRASRGNGVRFGVCFDRLSESEHLVVAGMLQLYRPQSLFLGMGDECVALLAGKPMSMDAAVDAGQLVAIIASETQRLFEHLTQLPCRVVRCTPGEDEPSSPGPFKVTTDLAGDVDIELILHAGKPSLEILARGAGFDGTDLEAASDSGLEIMSALAGRVADRMEVLELKEEILPFHNGEPLSARRPFDRRELFEVQIGSAPLLLEALLRLKTVFRTDLPDEPGASDTRS